MNEFFHEAFSFCNITKNFGSLRANDNVSFSVLNGGIHGVVGENGAGKSTIMKMLYGMFPPDSGEIFFKGQQIKILAPETAIALGIGMVHQHFMLVPTLTVWQNIILGREPSLWKLNTQNILKHLEKIKEAHGFQVDLNAKVEDLAVGQQQQVEILKLLYREADILILDEPTAVLSPQEVNSLFAKLRSLQQAHKTMVIISHTLQEILAITERVTIMRQGRVVETVDTASLTEITLAEKIIGRKRIPLPSTPTLSYSEPIFLVEKVSLKSPSGSVLNHISFHVNPGEIVGVAGIEGNGQAEIIEILTQQRDDYSGTVSFSGSDLKNISTYDLKQQGFSFIPPDRHQEAVVLSFSIAENAILGRHHEPSLHSGFWLSNKKIEELANSLIEKFDIRPSEPQLPLVHLSGGNQQKVVVGRETDREVSFLLAANPTRGIDIGAIDFIHSHFLKLKAQGTGILLISSELDELLTLSDRILVLYQGKIVAETLTKQATETQLGLWMTRGAN